MKFCILMGSPRLHANTAELCKPFIEELKANGAEITYITLANKNVNCKCKLDTPGRMVARVHAA